MRGRLLAFAILCGLAWPGRVVLADTLATDISSHLVQISSSFTGTSLLVFGAVEAEGPGRRDVVVVLRGPAAKNSASLAPSYLVRPGQTPRLRHLWVRPSAWFVSAGVALSHAGLRRAWLFEA